MPGPTRRPSRGVSSFLGDEEGMTLREAIDADSGVFVAAHVARAARSDVVKDLAQWLRVERSLAAICEGVDGLERLQINRNLLFSLAVANLNYTAKEDQTAVRDRFVKFQL